jgi:hypothetical protein
VVWGGVLSGCQDIRVVADTIAAELSGGQAAEDPYTDVMAVSALSRSFFF